MSQPPIRPRYHSIPPGGGPSLTGKDILVFCDGTGKDMSSGNEPPTNIGRLYQLAIQPETTISGRRHREIVYIPGVGSGSPKNPMNILSQIFGITIVENIVAAYLHVAKHYEARDGIHLFGYSRGAFIARKVASLIYRIGIVRSEEELLKLWNKDAHERPVPWSLLNSEPRGTAITIDSLVVWNTVGAIHSLPNQKKMELDILGMPDEELPPNVRHAFHIVAFHENRRLFRVTLFNPRSYEGSDRLKEVWFPGAHYDVGGGSIATKPDLSNISLIWVLGELQATCALTVPHIQLDYPELDKLTPSNAYHESPSWKRMVDKCETLISLLKPTSLIHESVLYLSNSVSISLDPRSNPVPHMLTINDLMKIGWDIRRYVVARNAFEVLIMKQASTSRGSRKFRPPPNTTNQPQNTCEFTPRSRRSSVVVQTRPKPSTPPPLTTPLRAESIRSRAESQATFRPVPTVAPQTGRREETSGTTPPRPPSAPPHPAVLVHATSTQLDTESYMASPTGTISPEHPRQVASDLFPVEAPRPRRIATSPTILASSRPSPSIPSHPPARVGPTGARLRAESHAALRLHSISPVGAIPFPSISPRPTAGQAIHHATSMQLSQNDRHDISPVGATSRSVPPVPCHQTMHEPPTVSSSPPESSQLTWCPIAGPLKPDDRSSPDHLPTLLTTDKVDDFTAVIDSSGLLASCPEDTPPGQTPIFKDVQPDGPVSCEQAELQETPSNSRSRSSFAQVMFERLVEHGCTDLSSAVNHSQFSSCMIAGGSYGDIWKGKLHDGVDIAIKVWRLNPITDDGEKSLKRATREIYNWSKTNHENIHKLLGVIMFQGRPGMVSKWMENGNLREYLNRNEASDRYPLCVQVANGVRYLHSENIVHGDLKACNILVSREGVPKLADFDHSIMSDCSLMFSETIRIGGGTLRWMAPELCRDEPCQRNKQTDVYALGMTLLEIITGDVPYPRCGTEAVVFKILQRKLPDRTNHFSKDKRGDRMWALLLKCWDLDPTARPPAHGVFDSLQLLIDQSAPTDD